MPRHKYRSRDNRVYVCVRCFSCFSLFRAEALTLQSTPLPSPPTPPSFIVCVCGFSVCWFCVYELPTHGLSSHALAHAHTRQCSAMQRLFFVSFSSSLSFSSLRLFSCVWFCSCHDSHVLLCVCVCVYFSISLFEKGEALF